MTTLRCYRAVRPFRLTGHRVLWEGDKVVLREDQAVEHLRVGNLVLAEPMARTTTWGAPMLQR